MKYLEKIIPASDPIMSLFTQILGKTCTYRPVQKLLLKDGFVTADEKRVSMGLKGKRVWGGGRRRTEITIENMTSL